MTKKLDFSVIVWYNILKNCKQGDCAQAHRRRMSKKGLGSYNTIGAFVDAKLRAFEEKGDSFGTMFELMFSEEENVMFEESVGHRLVKTTYGQAKREILEKAAALKELLSGLPEGSPVGLAMENSLNWIEIFWCILLCGYSPLLINLRIDRVSAERAIAQAGAKVVISDKNEYAAKTLKAEEIKAGGQTLEKKSFGREILVMTSGTTGEPKICAYTAKELHAQIIGSRQIIRECREAKTHYQNRLKLLTFLPFYHVFGLIAVYIWFAFFSRTFVKLNDMAPTTIVNTVKRHKVTHIFAVPLFWEKVYEQAKKGIAARGEKTIAKFEKGMRISDKLGSSALGNAFRRAAFKEVRENIFGQSVQFMITGGSFIEPEVLRFFNGIGYYLTNGYGMSEIGITSVDLEKNFKKRCEGSVGRPMACVEYKIEDGELLVRGQALASYVIENGVKKERGEWFATGDLAREENGRYMILGRKDDLVIAGAGENLNPNLIEPQLAAPGTNGVCLVSSGEGAKACPLLIVSLPGGISPEGFEKIEAAQKEKLEKTGLSSLVGRVVYTTEPLIGKDDFKVNRRRLKEACESGRLPLFSKEKSGESAENPALAAELKRFFATALDLPEGGEEIGMHADFFTDLGGTSLDYISLLAALRAHYGLPFETDGKSLHTVKDFYDCIRQR